MFKRAHLMTMLELSVVLNLFTLIVVSLHFIFSPSLGDIRYFVEVVDNNHLDLKENVNSLGDAQMNDFEGVKDMLEKNHGVSSTRWQDIQQTIEDEGKKNRREINKYCKSAGK